MTATGKPQARAPWRRTLGALVLIGAAATLVVGCRSASVSGQLIAFQQHQLDMPLRSSGFDPATRRWTATGLPSGLSIDGDRLVGAPLETGTFNVTLTVTDKDGSISRQMAVNVQPPSAASLRVDTDARSRSYRSLTVSDDGRRFAYEHWSTDPTYANDGLVRGQVTVVEPDASISSVTSSTDVEFPSPVISGNGEVLVFLRSSPLGPAVVRRSAMDVSAQPEVLSAYPPGGAPDGSPTLGAISDDGQTVAWIQGSALVVRSGTATPEVHDLGNDWVLPSSMQMSDDGRYVVFTRAISSAPSLHFEIHQLDRSTSVVTRLVGGNGWSQQPALSGDGSTMLFDSRATDLVAGTGNALYGHTYLWERGTGLVSSVADGGTGYSITDDGAAGAWSNGQGLIFWDRSTGSVHSMPIPAGAQVGETAISANQILYTQAAASVPSSPYVVMSRPWRP